MCLEEVRQVGRLSNCFTGGLLVSFIPVRVVVSVGPELGTEPPAGSLSTRQHAAGVVHQLSGGKVRVCFPRGCMRQGKERPRRQTQNEDTSLHLLGLFIQNKATELQCCPTVLHCMNGHCTSV